MASSRSLYHGTLIDHMPDIERSGLQPGVGGFTSDAYDLDEDGNYKQGPNAEDQYSPAELGIRPVVFMADKKRLDHSLNAIRHNVANKLGKGFHDITPQDVQDHGLLVKYKGQMGKQDPPANYVYDEQHEEPFENLHDKGTHPYQAEPGDFYSESPITNLQYIHGPAMMRVFKQNGSLPWSTPFGQEQQELEALRASSWNFVSAHQLQWTPGNHGKGLIAPNGDVHTWNLDAEDGPPHHGDYIEGVNEQTPRTFVLRNGYKGYDLFGIRPDGLYSGSLGLEKLDPRLVPTDKWNFQSATDGPVQVVNVDHWHTKEDPHPPKYLEGKLDKPFVYDPEGRTVYMGQPGGYHTDLWTMIPGTNPIERSGWPMGRLRETHIEDNPYTGEVDHIPQEAEWSSRPPENHEEVHQAIGAPPLSGKWAWIFNSAIQHQLGWQPGQYGKGLIHNGVVHTWGVGVNEDGSPTHPEYVETSFGMNEGQFANHRMFDTTFGINPEGGLNVYDDNGWSSHPENAGKVATQVETADPRLGTNPSQGTWDFQARVVKNDEKWQFAKTTIPNWNFQSNTTGTYHFNPWSGAFCTCPYNGVHRKMQRYAGMYINKVLKAPDKALRTPEGEAFKKHLAEHLPEEHESLAPWLAHRFKQGDIRLSPYSVKEEIGGLAKQELEWWDKAVPRSAFNAHWQDAIQKGVQAPNGRQAAEDRQYKTLFPAELDRWHAWYEAKQHPLRKGVNVMDKNFTPFEMSQVGNKHWKALQEQQQLDEYSHRGQTVHEFPTVKGGLSEGIDWNAVNDNEVDSGEMYPQRLKQLQVIEANPHLQKDSDDQYELEQLRSMYPIRQAPRPAGWHIKELQNSEDAEAEGHLMSHCFGSEEQPYGRCLDNGDITAYSLRDPKGKPHVTWHYNSDGSLAEMFGPNDDPIKPEYQEMLNEWGANNDREVDADNAEGMQEQAEDPLVTLPSAEGVNDYVAYHHPDYRLESAQNMEGNVGPDTEIDNENPNWNAIASDYLDKIPRSNLYENDPQRQHEGDFNDFHYALGENPGDHQEMDEALRDKVQQEFPHWPQLDQDERNDLPDHWRENLHRWDNWYNKPQQVNPWQFPSDLNHPTTPAMDPNINDHQIQMPIPSSDPAPTANSWGYQSSWITAPIIDDMRDGLGRFAVAAPWQPGSSGKGLYFPETGVLQTWSDDRTHPDVLFDDENAKSGNAHHIIIRPNGTVRDQGCLDKDFADADGDVEGLHKALSELDPRLRLDAPNTWDFGGPTEPVEEEPSSVSRGEDGGSVHGVQTSGDYAGSL